MEGILFANSKSFNTVVNIYKHFFITLYGKTTISRNRLCLMDNDEAEWGPLDSVMNTMPCWKPLLHMLCSFHAITLRFFEDIHPKLPHTGNGKNRSLTTAGKHYGTCVLFASMVALYHYIWFTFFVLPSIYVYHCICTPKMLYHQIMFTSKLTLIFILPATQQA